VRLIILLLAIALAMGATAQGVCAMPDVVSAVDDAPDGDTPVVPELTAAPAPEHCAAMRVELPQEPARGRLHQILVFRPPR